MSIETGFPSPAQGYEEQEINLQQLLIKHPAATFCMRIQKSHPELNLFKGDVVTVDRSVVPHKNSLVVYSRGGVFSCEFLKILTEKSVNEELQIFGVITNIIHNLTGSL